MDDAFYIYPLGISDSSINHTDDERQRICLDLHAELKESFYNQRIAIHTLKIVEKGKADAKLKRTAQRLKIATDARIDDVQQKIVDEKLNCQEFLR